VISELNQEAGMRSPREDALRHTSDFHAVLLGMAGHDLRQPLQVIQSAYDWLGPRISSPADRAQLERGERAIAKLGEQLDRLVGVLRWYQDTSSMILAPVALEPLFDDLCAENGEYASERCVDLRVSPTRAVVTSNAVMLDAIVRNLVRNAIKYTPPGGRILIGCRRRGSSIRIDVCDTGIGIPPEQMPRVFQAFERMDSTRCDGLGLGLFVVRRAVELLEHRVEVSSVVGRGSRFSVLARAAGNICNDDAQPRRSGSCACSSSASDGIGE
jgi:two-component system phosphate regulon sensor histidine kinase PhoR